VRWTFRAAVANWRSRSSFRKRYTIEESAFCAGTLGSQLYVAGYKKPSGLEGYCEPILYVVETSTSDFDCIADLMSDVAAVP
jgi:hypothetical protein